MDRRTSQRMTEQRKKIAKEDTENDSNITDAKRGKVEQKTLRERNRMEQTLRQTK